MIDLARLNDMAFAKYLGMVFESVGDGESVVTLQSGPQHSNLQDRIHGGVVPALIDAAGATAIWSTRPVDTAVLTADLRTNFVSTGPIGDKITATARVDHVGGSSGFASVTVTSASGEIIALGQVTGILRSRKA